jgi:aspartyl protease family protein
MSDLGEMLSSQPLLILAIASVLVAMAGWQMQHSHPDRGRLLRNLGYVGMAAAVLLTAGLAAYRADKSDAALAMAKRPQLMVRGSGTAIPVDADGHYWVEALINGKPADFLIDTGATFTSLTGENARALGIEPTPGGMPASFDTANGTAQGRFTRLASLEFGTIKVRNLDAVIMVDDDGDTNVIGMNLLSMLKSWRVEGGTLTLQPGEPAQP